MKFSFKVTLALLSTTFLNCNDCQNSSIPEPKLDKIIYEFHPSFTYSSNFIISEGHSSVEFEIYKPAYFFGENKREMITYDRLVMDSTKVIRLFDVCQGLSFDSTRVNERMILDGISGRISKYANNQVYEVLRFRSPDRKNYKLDYEAIDAFFLAIEETAASNQNLNEYLENLKGYFDYGLPIKQVNKSPLEFRIWGSLTVNEEKELYEFLDSLPKKEPIIFDMTNFPGMGTIFYDRFRKLNNNHYICYLVNKDHLNEDLESIGNCNIYTNREQIKKYFEKINRDNYSQNTAPSSSRR